MTVEGDRHELPEEYASLPVVEFGFPGELRDRLIAAILAGEKTTTSCLYLELEVDGEELPEAGQRELVIDSAGQTVAVIELTGIRVLPLGAADRQHALDEGEGFTGVDDWRRGHEEYWHSAQYREAIRQPEFTVDDTTLMVALRFRLVEDLRGSPGRQPRPADPGTSP